MGVDRIPFRSNKALHCFDKCLLQESLNARKPRTLIKQHQSPACTIIKLIRKRGREKQHLFLLHQSNKRPRLRSVQGFLQQPFIKTIKQNNLIKKGSCLQAPKKYLFFLAPFESWQFQQKVEKKIRIIV